MRLSGTWLLPLLDSVRRCECLFWLPNSLTWSRGPDSGVAVPLSLLKLSLELSLELSWELSGVKETLFVPITLLDTPLWSRRDFLESPDPRKTFADSDMEAFGLGAGN